jgi:hypothetical protein
VLGQVESRGQWLAAAPGAGDRESVVRLFNRDGTAGPTLPAIPESRTEWSDAATMAVWDGEWVDVHTLSADGQFQLVRNTRFPSRPGNCVFDAPRKRLYSWEMGAIQALDLSTGEPLFTVLPVDKSRTVRIDPTGQLDAQDPDVEKELIYYIAEPDGSTTLHAPAEFRKHPLVNAHRKPAVRSCRS